MNRRVLHITYSIRTGGLEKFVLRLCRGYSSDYEPMICTMSDGGELAEEFRRSDILVFRCPKPDRIAPLLPIRIARLFGRLKVDLIHTHNVAPLIYGGIAATIGAVPMVHTEHSRLLRPQRRLEIVERLISLKTSKIIAVSECVAEQLRQQGINPRKITSIPNGVDFGEIQASLPNRARVRRSLGVNEDEVLIGTVGRLVPVKDQATLIASFARVSAKSARPVRLMIVGDGPERSNLEDRARKLGLNGRVLFMGMRDDVPDLIGAMDIFVLSSIDEGLPLAVLEAMAGGLPVVSTEVGGVPEAVRHGENGFLVPPRSPDALSAAMLKLVDDHEIRRVFSDRAARTATERFSLNAMIRAYEEVYEEVLGK